MALEDILPWTRLLADGAMIFLAIWIGIVHRNQLALKGAHVELLSEGIRQAEMQRDPVIAGEYERMSTLAKNVIEERNRVEAELLKAKKESAEKDELVEKARRAGSVIALVEALGTLSEYEELRKKAPRYAMLLDFQGLGVTDHLMAQLESLFRRESPTWTKGAAWLKAKKD